jgi:hypothetical protein
MSHHSRHNLDANLCPYGAAINLMQNSFHYSQVAQSLPVKLIIPSFTVYYPFRYIGILLSLVMVNYMGAPRDRRADETTKCQNPIRSGRRSIYVAHAVLGWCRL